MGRVMAIVSQAWLTMAIIGVSFFRSSITIAKAVSLGLLMYSRTGGPLITCHSRKKLCVIWLKTTLISFVIVSGLCGRSEMNTTVSPDEGLHC